MAGSDNKVCSGGLYLCSTCHLGVLECVQVCVSEYMHAATSCQVPSIGLAFLGGYRRLLLCVLFCSSVAFWHGPRPVRATVQVPVGASSHATTPSSVTVSGSNIRNFTQRPRRSVHMADTVVFSFTVVLFIHFPLMLITD